VGPPDLLARKVAELAARRGWFTALDGPDGAMTDPPGLGAQLSGLLFARSLELLLIDDRYKHATPAALETYLNGWLGAFVTRPGEDVMRAARPLQAAHAELIADPAQPDGVVAALTLQLGYRVGPTPPILRYTVPRLKVPERSRWWPRTP
jgi:hypothetical protein